MSHITGKAGADAFLPNVEAALADDKGDIVWKSIICCKGGKDVVAPPPPDPTPVKKKEAKAAKAVVVADPGKEAMTQALTVTGGSAIAIAASMGGDPAFMALINTFGL